MKRASVGLWLRKHFEFRGRLSRIAFWRIWLGLQLFVAIAWGLGLYASITGGKLGLLILAPTLVAYVVALASCLVRRLHDRSRSGWWLVPFFGGPILVQAILAQHVSSPGRAWAALAV